MTCSERVSQWTATVSRQRIPPSQSPTGQRVGLVEPGDGAGTQLRIESGERVAGPVAGSTRRDAAPAVNLGMKLLISLQLFC
jgi:hypothetical protein